MKKLMLGAATAAVLLTAAAAPAMAQFGVRVGPVGVGIGAPYYNSYGGCGYNYACGGPYYDSYGGPSVVIGDGGWHGHPHYHRHWHR